MRICPPGQAEEAQPGDGATGIAARRLARKWIGIELNPEGEIDCAHARFEMEFGGVE